MKSKLARRRRIGYRREGEKRGLSERKEREWKRSKGLRRRRERSEGVMQRRRRERSVEREERAEWQGVVES